MSWFGNGVSIGSGQRVAITPEWVKVVGAGGFITRQQYPLADVHGIVMPERNVLNFVGAGGAVLGTVRITKPISSGIHREIQTKLETMQQKPSAPNSDRKKFKWR
jgi:hypothetical protein